MITIDYTDGTRDKFTCRGYKVKDGLVVFDEPNNIEPTGQLCVPLTSIIRFWDYRDSCSEQGEGVAR